MNPNDTIVAAATPYGFGGIAVIRICGHESLHIAEKITKSSHALDDRKAITLQLHEQNNKPYDKAVVTFFKGPNSYTGENVVEISCHGNPHIVEKTVSAAIDLGARAAEPGEFTRRAFLNGKLDLLQAESVAALVHSQGQRAAQLNHRVLSGELSGAIEKLKKNIVNVLSIIEFELDISEDEADPNVELNTVSALTKISSDLGDLLKTFGEGRLLNRGASVVITGPPNVGKSTLFNALINENRAIVSPTPGTTRDALVENIILDDIAIVLSDTAGIRASNELIEKEGISRARKKIKTADVVLNLHEPKGINANLSIDNNNNTIDVLNKSDLLTNSDKNKNPNKGKHFVNISAKTGDGLKGLKSAITSSLKLGSGLSDSVFLITQRQYDIVSTCKEAVDKALSIVEGSEFGYELLSIEIREALSSIDRVLGKTTSEDILNNIFGKFCVGK